MCEISASTGSLNINLTFEHRRASQSSGDSNLMLHVRHVLRTNHIFYHIAFYTFYYVCERQLGYRQLIIKT